ncbi:hypothetical protein [Anaerovibrio sp.]|uniref:hypothetical protein n=1 Tax=Anaerovibrio sp. TaxID=1872532 RepID=UPI00388D79B5
MSWMFNNFKKAVDHVKDVEKEISIDRDTKKNMELEEAKSWLDSLKEQIKEDHKTLLYLYENGFAKRFPKHSLYGQKFICDDFTGTMGIFPESNNAYKKIGIVGKFGFFDSDPEAPCLIFDNELLVVDSEDSKQLYIPHAPTKTQIIEFCEKFEDFHKEFTECVKNILALEDMVAAGDWHINEESFKKYSNGEMDCDLESMGSVYYGNNIYDLAYGQIDNNDPCNVADNVSGVFIHLYKPFGITEFEEVTVDFHGKNRVDLCGKYLDLVDYPCDPIHRTKANCTSIEELKKDIVKEMLESKVLDPGKIAKYKEMNTSHDGKIPSGFPHQFEAAKNALKSSEKEQKDNQVLIR